MDDNAKEKLKTKLKINQDICIRCGSCSLMYPQYFKEQADGSVREIDGVEIPLEEQDEVLTVCPSGAIEKVTTTEDISKTDPNSK